jgi:hypothetical protein
LSPDPGPLPELRVEVREGFVEQQQPRRVRQGSRQGDPLLLAARELVGVAVDERPELDQLEHLGHPGGPLLVPVTPELQRVADVLCNGHVRPDRVRLEDDPALPGLRCQVHSSVAVEEHGVTGDDPTPVGPVEAGYGPEGRGLPTTARTEEGEELALDGMDGHMIERDVVAEGLAQAGDDELRHGGALRT